MEVREYISRKDIGYVASFTPRDAEKIQRIVDRINLRELDPNVLFGSLDKIYDDHKVNGIEPIKLGKSGNKLVNEGLNGLADMQMGARQQVFGVYAIGQGTLSVSPNDDALEDECGRLDIRDNNGTFLSRGSTCFYSVFFPKTTADCDVSETGIVDSLDTSNDNMLLRTVLPTADIIIHHKDESAIFVGHVIFSASA